MKLGNPILIVSDEPVEFDTQQGTLSHREVEEVFLVPVEHVISTVLPELFLYQSPISTSPLKPLTITFESTEQPRESLTARYHTWG